MKKIILLSFCTLALGSIKAQFVYKIKADSILLTKDTCAAELILENRTKDTLGFLYNKGNGRTEFRRGAIKLTDSTYIFGNDIINFKTVFNSIGTTSPNIYNSNGTLTNNRTVTLGGNNLDFSGTTPIRVSSDGKLNIGSTSILGNLGKVNIEGSLFVKPKTNKKSYFLLYDSEAPSNLLHTLDYSNSLYPNGVRYDFAAGYQNDTSTYAPFGTTSGIWNISFFKTDSLQSPVTNRPLMTINNGPGVGIFNTPILKLFSSGNLVLNSNDDAGFKLDVNGTARINTIPFLGNRDTVLTYDPVTKQVLATKITASGGSGLPDPGSNGIIVKNGSGTTVARTMQITTGKGVIVNSDGVNGNPVIDPALTSGGYFRTEAEFLNTNVVQGQYIGFAISSGTNSNAPVISANHPGVVLMRSSTTANSGYSYLTGNVARIELAGGEVFNVVFRTTTSFTNTTMRAGYHNTSSSSLPTDGVYFEYAGNGNIVGKTANAAAYSTTSTITTLTTNTWYHARITINETKTQAVFTIYNESGTQLGSQTITSNFPVSGRLFSTGIIVTNSGTTATDLLHIDYMDSFTNKKLQRGDF
ncbi:MAG: hypothetical protein HEQ40_12315 [Lacibacter sp.]|jgi:hypothetical protein